jgi:hypothetical protein
MAGPSKFGDGGSLDAGRRRGNNGSMVEETLQKIEAAISRAQKDGPANKQELVRLLGELKAELETERRGDVLRPIDKGLRDAAIEFTGTHPQLAGAVNEISTLLASIGI